ncbi:hypothetical protein BVY03_00360 [bacterium K02(2017)]|nr:hypothetical protein BVY03_00360 [bacterium K02(2017)]
MGNEFVFDDIPYIRESPPVKDISKIGQSTLYTLNKASLTRSITVLSFAFNHYLHGFDVFGFHLFNLIIHLINGILIWLFVYLSLNLPKLSAYKNYQKELPFFAALLFITHPVQTQAVSYLAQRFASLATLFYLFSFVIYIYFRSKKSFNLIAQTALISTCFISAVLGALSKEIVFTLPVMLLIYEFYFLDGKEALNKIKSKAWIITPALLCFIAIPFILFEPSFVLKPRVSHAGEIHTFNKYFITQFSCLITYLRLLILPIYQNLDYDFKLSQSFFSMRSFIGFWVLSGLFYTAYKCFKKHRLISFGVLWFLITISIESSIIPLKNLFFEHRLYLPLLGFILFSLGLAYKFIPARHTKNIKYALMIIIVLFSAASYNRNKVWKNELTLWSDVANKSPNKARPHHNLGIAIYHQNKFKEAINEFSKAIKINAHVRTFNSVGDSYLMRGNAYQHLKDYDKALSDYSNVIKIDPTQIFVYNNRGNILSNLGKHQEALKDYDTAIKMAPNYTEAIFNRGALLFNLKKTGLALKDLQRAKKLNPKDPQINQLYQIIMQSIIGKTTKMKNDKNPITTVN